MVIILTCLYYYHLITMVMIWILLPKVIYSDTVKDISLTVTEYIVHKQLFSWAITKVISLTLTEYIVQIATFGNILVLR